MKAYEPKMFRCRVTVSGLAYGLLPAVAALWFVLPVFDEPGAWGSTRDWGYFTFLEEVTRKTILEFGQFPLWNPYYFGGAEHLANPQTTVLSPTTLCTTAMGTALGLKVGILLFAVLGCCGMYTLARHLGCLEPAAAVGALIYGCSGWFAQHVGGGHWGFAAVNLYPWVAFFYLRSMRRPLDFTFAVLFAGWVAVHWGIYPLPWLLMLLLVITVGELARHRRLDILGRFALLVLFTVSLTAVRLLPVLEYVQRFPRTVANLDRMSFEDLLYVFLAQHTEREFPGHAFEWPEYGNYIGWVPLLLLIIGLKVKFPRKKLLWVGAALFLLLALGNWGFAAPFSILHKLPLLEYLRVPSRYTIAALFFMALIVGLSYSAVLDALMKRWPGRGGLWLPHVLSAIVLLSIVGDSVRFNRKQFEQSFHLPPPTDAVSGSFVQRRGDPGRMYAYPRANQGSVLGLEESPIPVSRAIRIDADRQHFLALGGDAYAEDTYWSPNELHFFVGTPVENLLVINQNYRKEWQASQGLTVEDYRGLLAVRIRPGRHSVVLKYAPSSFRIGAIISLITLSALALWIFQVLRKTRDAGAGGPPT